MQKRNLPNRKSIRLKGWDYRNPGLYFVTICTKDRRHHFGEIRDGIMGLSVPGCVTNYYWNEIIDQFHSVKLDEYIVMPNHIHGIVGITRRVAIHGDRNDNGGRNDTDGKNIDKNGQPDAVNRVPTEQTDVGSPIHRDPVHNKQKNAGGATGKHNPMLYKTHLGKIIRWYKGRCTFEIRKRNYFHFVWQSRFHDHIIRNEKELNRIRRYISDNPMRWQVDRENKAGEYMHEQGVNYMVDNLNKNSNIIL